MPNYKKIYTDIIDKKCPEKMQEFLMFLNKENLSVLDIIKLNQKIFGIPDKQKQVFNQMHKAYDKKAIFEILDYQKKNGLNNSQLAVHFKLSRNTVSKWKNKFLT